MLELDDAGAGAGGAADGSRAAADAAAACGGSPATVREVEAELLLWDTELELQRLLPVEARPLLLLHKPTVLTSGSAEWAARPRSWASRQDETVVMLVADDKRGGAAATPVAPSPHLPGNHQPPPPSAVPPHAVALPHALVGRLAEQPRWAAPGSLFLLIVDGASSHQIELRIPAVAVDAGSDTGVYASMGAQATSLRAGHHPLVTNLLPTRRRRRRWARSQWHRRDDPTANSRLEGAARSPPWSVGVRESRARWRRAGLDALQSQLPPPASPLCSAHRQAAGAARASLVRAESTAR